MTDVFLLCDVPDTSVGAVAGTVDIVDATLRRVAGAVVLASQPVHVELPNGLFFAAGRLTSGARVSGAVQVGATRQRWRLEVEPVAQPPLDPVRGWFGSWSCYDGQWSGGRRLVFQGEEDRPEIVVGGGDAGESAVLQMTLTGQPCLMCVVPPGSPLSLRRRSPGQAELAPREDVTKTLLQQMQWGDLSGADLTVTYVLDYFRGPSDVQLLDLLVGHHLRRRGNVQDARRWARDLVRRWPLSLDAAVLDTYGDDPASGASAYRLAELLNFGLPVLRESLRLMVNAMEIGQASPDSLAVAQGYLRCAHARPLTTFYATHPATPELAPVAADEPSFAVHYGPGRLTDTGADTPQRHRPSIRDHLRFVVPVQAYASLGDPDPAPPRAGALELPPSARRALGVRVSGSATLRRGVLHVVLDPVDAHLLAERAVVVQVDDRAAPLRWEGSALVGSLVDIHVLPSSVTLEILDDPA